MLLGNLVVSQLVKKITYFMDPKCSLPWSQFISILNHIKPVRALPYHAFKNQFDIIIPSTTRSSKLSFSLRFPHKSLQSPLLSIIHSSCPAHLIRSHFITQITLGEKFKSPFFCHFLHRSPRYLLQHFFFPHFLQSTFLALR